MEQKQLFHFDLLSPEVSMLNNEKAHLRALGSAGCGLWCLVMGYINVCYLTESPRHISCTVHQPTQPSPGSPVWPPPAHGPAHVWSCTVQCTVRTIHSVSEHQHSLVKLLPCTCTCCQVSTNQQCLKTTLSTVFLI